MKLSTPFTILNKKFNEMDLIRHAMKSKEKSATERLHDDYRKILNLIPVLFIVKKNIQLLVIDMFSFFERFKLLEVNYFI